MTEMKSVTVRIHESTYERLKKTANERNISQGKLIENLINTIQANPDHKESKSQDTQIRLLLKYENYFLSQDEKKVREPKNYVFTGRWVWPRYEAEKQALSLEHLKEKLKAEFEIVDSLDDCECTYIFYILYDSVKNRYIINEIFLICRNDFKNKMLHVIRCKFAMNLYEIKRHLNQYAEKMDFTTIESCIAPDIFDDAEVEMFLK